MLFISPGFVPCFSTLLYLCFSSPPPHSVHRVEVLATISMAPKTQLRAPAMSSIRWVQACAAGAPSSVPKSAYVSANHSVSLEHMTMTSPSGGVRVQIPSGRMERAWLSARVNPPSLLAQVMILLQSWTRPLTLYRQILLLSPVKSLLRLVILPTTRGQSE